MLTFDIAATISIFVLKQVKNAKNQDLIECHIDRCAEIRINELLPHPTCVISTQLTALNYHSEASFFCHEMDSLLVNVSGHLLLLSPFNKDNPENSDDDNHFQVKKFKRQKFLASSTNAYRIPSGEGLAPTWP